MGAGPAPPRAPAPTRAAGLGPHAHSCCRPWPTHPLPQKPSGCHPPSPSQGPGLPAVHAASPARPHCLQTAPRPAQGRPPGAHRRRWAQRAQDCSSWWGSAYRGVQSKQLRDVERGKTNAPQLLRPEGQLRGARLRPGCCLGQREGCVQPGTQGGSPCPSRGS